MMMKTIRHVTRDLNSRGKIATVQMRLKTFHDLQATFNTSNPSLMETTSAAAAGQQVKLDALAKTDKNINKTPVNDKNKTAKIENTNGKKKFKKRKIMKIRGVCLPTKTLKTALLTFQQLGSKSQLQIISQEEDLTVDQRKPSNRRERS
ncbi:hypothetical protein TNCV_3578041 [Trichonephila clavipes]|nr:hypothetical protein TNCV_3578041 [Trichonephila clavipes]